MRRAVDRTIAETIPAPPADVRAYYVDLHNLAALHPLVVSITTVSDETTPEGRRTTYRVKDHVPVGFLTLPTVYTATMQVPPDGPVNSVALQSPGVRLDSTVSFEAVADGTRLTEQIRISAPWPLRGLTVRRAVAAHIEMLAGIRRHFGG